MWQRIGSITLLATVPLLPACDLGGPDRAYRGLPEFCRDALARVDAFMAEQERPEDERYGGTLVMGGIGEVADGMNALVSADYSANQHQTHVNLMTLLRFGPDLELEPYLARAWELSDDGTEVIFHLRDDVYWHDGERTTAYDVEFTYLRATDPETAFPNAAFWTHYVRGPDGVEVVDSTTVRFQLQPHADPLDPWRTMAIMPRHLLGNVPPSELGQHPFGTRCPVGNGPFRFVEHRQDESWSFEANPAFPEELGGRPYLDRYVYRVVPEPTTLLAELLTENLDIYVSPTPDQAERVRAEEGLGLEVFPSRDYVFVAWNSRRPQLSDARVRRAITLATNRHELVEAVIGGLGGVANSGVPPFHWAYQADLADSLRYDPDQAEALLDDAGWVDRNGDGIREDDAGRRLEVSIAYNQGNQQRQQIAEIMQSQLREVGIDARPQVMEWGALVSRITNPEERDFDGVVLRWVSEFKVDDTDLFHSSGADQPYGWAGIQDPELDEILERLQLLPDRREALPHWREYQLKVMELQPYTYIYYADRIAGVNRRVRDVEMDVRGEWAGIHRWWIAPEDRTGRVAVR